MGQSACVGKTIRGAIIAILLLGLAAGAWGQEGLTAKVESSGTVRVLSGAAELATIDLNAHGVGWKNVPQTEAKAQVSDLPDQAGKRVTGTLTIPDATGGVLRFTETVKPVPQGLAFEYDVSVAQALKLNGLQVSLSLPASRYAGKELLIGQPDREPDVGTFPLQMNDQNSQVWSGEGERVEVGKGTADDVSVRMRAVTDILIQDLRRWQHDTFEVRFPAIMDDAGRDVTTTDRFHLDFIVTFAAPVKLAGP